MSHRVRTFRRLLPTVALIALAGTGVLAGCAGEDGSADGQEAAAGSSSADSAATGSSGPELSDGLLPADAFGGDATVVSVTAEQLRQGAGLAADAQDLQITPSACAGAVKGTQPDVTAFDDIAAQSATTAGSTTVEVLMRGGPTVGSLDSIEKAVATCPEAQVSSPELGTATITFQTVQVPDLGDGSAALQFTTVVTQPDGTSVTVPALVGMVQDGDRLVSLVSLSQNGAPQDAAAFTGLLEQAYQVQAAALD